MSPNSYELLMELMSLNGRIVEAESLQYRLPEDNEIQSILEADIKRLREQRDIGSREFHHKMECEIGFQDLRGDL